MGGRGGSSGLSGGGGGSLPALEGSEKQVKWAEDIINGRNFTDQKIKSAFESNESSGANVAIRRIVEYTVLEKNKEKFDGSMTGMREQFRSEQYTRQYVKSHNIEMTDDFKKRMETDRKKAKKKYNQWVAKEYRKILETEKSAKWWIDHR